MRSRIEKKVVFKSRLFFGNRKDMGCCEGVSLMYKNVLKLD